MHRPVPGRWAMVLGALVLPLAACAPDVPPLEVAGATVSPSPAPTRQPPSGTGAIGKATVSFASGVVVGVPSAQQFTPSSTAVGHSSGNVGVKLVVSVENKREDALDGPSVIVGLKAAGKFTNQIFDPEQDVDAGFTGKIAPGTTAKATYGFDVPQSALSAVIVNVNADTTTLGVARFPGPVAD